MKLILAIIYWPLYLVYATANNQEAIVLDLKANNHWNGSAFFSIINASRNKYFRSLLYYRNRNFISKIVRGFYPKDSSLIIDIRSQIGGGLKLAHPYATIINCESMGINCYINHLVTIGKKNGQRPIIGNNVEIHANACVIGGITIGDNAIIGAGAVVVKDVPANGIAIGNPARIIAK